MSRTMLSLTLLAAFGIMATLQSPLLFKSSVRIPGLNTNSFLNASEFGQTLQAHYKQKPADLPKNIYIFNVNVEDNVKPIQVSTAVRDMKATKQIFFNSPNGMITNYFRYNKSAEVTESLLSNLKTLGAVYERNVSTLNSFEKSVTQRTKSSSLVADVVSVNLTDIKSLDRFLIQTEKALIEKSDGKFLILVTFNTPQAQTKFTKDDVEYFTSRRILQTSNDTNDTNTTTMAISSNTFTGITVGLFVAAVVLTAVGLLADIKTPGGFIATPLHIGKEH